MDPITRAAQTFLHQAETAWRTNDTRPLRMVVAPSDRVDLLKTLRLAELAPDNRRPFFLYERPFLDAPRYFEGLATSIEDDYARIRQGAAEEGVALAPFGGLPETARGLERALHAMEQVATHLCEHLDGVLVALAPARLSDPRRFQRAIQSWITAPCSRHIRRAVLDVPGGPLEALFGDAIASFEVDQAAIFDHIAPMGGQATEGPPLPPQPAPQEEHLRMIHPTMGAPLLSMEMGQALRAELLSAMRSMSDGAPEAAAERYRVARTLCQKHRLVHEEIMVLLALGGALLSARAPLPALEAFIEAAQRGSHAGAWALVAHAWFSAGGVLTLERQRHRAREAYAAAAEAAAKADLPDLAAEARRQENACA